MRAISAPSSDEILITAFLHQQRHRVGHSRGLKLHYKYHLKELVVSLILWRYGVQSSTGSGRTGTLLGCFESLLIMIKCLKVQEIKLSFVDKDSLV
jgi:hypothetical protein